MLERSGRGAPLGFLAAMLALSLVFLALGVALEGGYRTLRPVAIGTLMGVVLLSVDRAYRSRNR